MDSYSPWWFYHPSSLVSSRSFCRPDPMYLNSWSSIFLRLDLSYHPSHQHVVDDSSHPSHSLRPIILHSLVLISIMILLTLSSLIRCVVETFCLSSSRYVIYSVHLDLLVDSSPILLRFLESMDTYSFMNQITSFLSPNSSNNSWLSCFRVFLYTIYFR